MKRLSMCLLFLGLVTASCTIPDVPEGECGTDVPLGHDTCQCVASDDGYSNGSKRFTPGKEKELKECTDKQNEFYVTLEDKTSEIYVCTQYKCDKATCEEGTIPDDRNMKCIKQCAPNEIHEDDNTCVCDTKKHFEGETGSCTCKTGYVLIDGACKEKQTCREDQVYVETDNTCVCPRDHEELDGRKCVHTKTCAGANQVYDPEKDACVCNEETIRFGDTCITREECTDKRVDNGDGTCTCFGRYTYMYGDCFTVGDSMTFGRYPQNENSEVPLPLTWRILEINDDSALLLSEYVIEQYTYHDQKEDITWEWCNVRSYLNGFDGSHNKNGIDHTGKGFIDIAFTPAERRQIKTVTNKNPDAPKNWNSTPGGNDTEDKVFLLSRDETLKYFPTNKSRIASPTAYALHPSTNSGRENLWTCPITCSSDNSCACKEGTWSNNASNVRVCSNVQCGSYWWLRSPASRPDYAAYVYVGGGVINDFVSYANLGLRPALYVRLSSEF